jgi:acyl carrier protein
VDIDEEKITEDTHFVRDLGLNSYDFVSIVGKVESDLGIEIPDIEIRDLQTAGDMANYLKKKME